MNPDQLKNLVPLHTLADDLLARLAEQVSPETLPAGQVLCEQGDREVEAIYLLDGSVELSARGSAMKRTVMGGTPDAAYALAPGTPRQFTALATTRVTVIRIPSEKIDRLLVFERLTTIVTTMNPEGKPQPADDPMVEAVVAGSALFRRLPRFQVGELVEAMLPLKVRAGEEVVRQGQANDRFFVVQDGRFEATHRDAQGKERMRRSLERGATFGADALLSGAPSPTTVTALENGLLLTLSRVVFERFLAR
jgi:CRP-like cAMP-binding protein